MVQLFYIVLIAQCNHIFPLLLYVFYYQGSNNQTQINKTNNLDTKVTEEQSSNFFEDVEYKGIDANGNRYLLISKLEIGLTPFGVVVQAIMLTIKKVITIFFLRSIFLILLY